ncbi:hypothetical protein H4Q26_009635 [Puccinia striiformis f. sp. tritici PST-130]|nr:hypothetical protein H4Q26_009635 [Puccinia striiformis f. sp. tritici PST-130]
MQSALRLATHLTAGLKGHFSKQPVCQEKQNPKKSLTDWRNNECKPAACWVPLTIRPTVESYDRHRPRIQTESEVEKLRPNDAEECDMRRLPEESSGHSESNHSPVTGIDIDASGHLANNGDVDLCLLINHLHPQAQPHTALLAGHGSPDLSMLIRIRYQARPWTQLQASEESEPSASTSAITLETANQPPTKSLEKRAREPEEDEEKLDKKIKPGFSKSPRPHDDHPQITRQ